MLQHHIDSPMVYAYVRLTLQTCASYITFEIALHTRSLQSNIPSCKYELRQQHLFHLNTLGLDATCITLNDCHQNRSKHNFPIIVNRPNQIPLRFAHVIVSILGTMFNKEVHGKHQSNKNEGLHLLSEKIYERYLISL